MYLNDFEKNELENYFANKFVKQDFYKNYDEDFLSAWENLIINYNAEEILNEHICKARPVQFISPDDIKIEIYQSLAGKIPTIIFGDASDFENFIVNLIYKGSKPQNINLSRMGASFVYGKEQRFLILSKKFYSGVYVNVENWPEKSMIIRREHECTHYYTKKFYGSASNNLHDELIADFCGIYKAFGFYKAELFKKFMGVDGSNEGRLSLYTIGLSDNVKKIIAEAAARCSDFLEKWSLTETFKNMNEASRINYLCETNLKNMAGL